MNQIICITIVAIICAIGISSYPFKARGKKGTPKCKVGIVGGGFSGLFMAYRLLKTKKESHVCIFEKDAEVGGRIHDFRFEEAPNVHVGLGAWRIDKKHYNMLDLLNDLGILHTGWTFVKPTLIESRGVKANNKEDIKKGYPTLLAHPLFGNMTSSELFAYAVRQEFLAKADEYATSFTYFSNMITPEGAEYLSELYGYKGDFFDFISPQSFIEYSELEFKFSGEYVRPKGGMSTIITRLKKKVEELGCKIFTNTEVTRLFKRMNRYVLVTPRFRVKSNKIIIATTPEQLKKISGSTAKKIQDTDEFDSIQPVSAFKGAAVYSSAWWENVEVAGTPIKAGQKFLSSSNCLGTSMAHRDKGTNGEGVLHTMYVDGDCARRWNDIAALEKKYIDAEVHRALETKYETKIPKPLDTSYKYWDSAWHYQKPGTFFSLVDISNWAKRPFKEENIFIVGEAYHPFRGWCEGAILSSKHALEEGWSIPMDEVGEIAERSIEIKEDLSKLVLSKRMIRPYE